MDSWVQSFAIFWMSAMKSMWLLMWRKWILPMPKWWTRSLRKSSQAWSITAQPIPQLMLLRTKEKS